MSQNSPAKSQASFPTASAERAPWWRDLQAIVGEEHVATSADAIDGRMPEAIVEPATAEELARVLEIANSKGLKLAARGGGSKLEWGNPPRDLQLIVSTRRLNAVLEHAWADMTASVQAGCTVQSFQQTLAQHGQRLAVDALWPARATIGGMLATNDSGSLRARFGGLRDLIIGVTVALPDGTLAKSGGKVVKNVAGYDLPKLIAGSLGTLGIITQAIFRLHPLPRTTRSVSFTFDTAEELNQLALAILDSQMAFTGLQARMQIDAAPLLDVRFEGVEGAIDAQVRQLTNLGASKPQMMSDAPAGVWTAREELFAAPSPCIVSKCSIMPSEIAALSHLVETISPSFDLRWKLVMQGVGLGYLLLEGQKFEALAEAARRLRSGVEERHGSLVLLRCPLELKKNLEAWGAAGDALPLMRRVKQQFDPAGILNPGRFVGGI